ncbi:MAG: ROK family glucokinase [Lachnospiraceae bacterium]|nr:ROK family glucokinase [Lachnospiraceae bacterium]
MKKCFGIDLGGTTVKMGLFEENGVVLEKWEIPTRTEENGKYILSDIAKAVLDKMAEKGLNGEDIVGAGIGIPGPVMPDGYVSACVNLGWRNVNPGKGLSDLLGGISVCVGNDANVAALGEQWQGGGKGHDSVAAVTLGTGLGCGIILDGKIVSGSRGVAGELGHVTVNRDETEKCNCGNRGCLEFYASATGIARLAKRHLAASDEASVLRGLEKITAKDVVDAAKAGDALADSVLEESMNWLAQGLSFVTLVVDPEVFVVGGGVSKAGDFLLDKLRRHYNHYTVMTATKPEIRVATLGNDAGIYGAARMVLNM